MHTIISIVGKSSSGKTTLMVELIKELKGRGHKVAIIKHSHHAYELDQAQKDTWRFAEAGSDIAAIKSADNLAMFRHIDHYFDPQEISNFILWDYDFILTEGFKGSDYPKIEVHRKELGEGLLTEPEQLIGVVTDEPLDVKVPQFPPDQYREIADLIEKMVADNRVQDDVDLVVNGEYIPLDPSLKDVLVKTLFAMLPDLNGKDEIKNLHLSLRRNT